MHLERESLNALAAAIEQLESAFGGLPEFEARAAGVERMGEVLGAAAARMGDNFPYFHPFYAGQMLKPPHPAARAAYALAMWINPNNHALDGGRASSAMEKEAVAEIARMFGWTEHLGHLTSGGTFANLEALWVAGLSKPGRSIVASDQAHYTHERISGVLKLPFEKVASDGRGKMDVDELERRLETGRVGCVVATLGTTGAGAVDPLERILRLRERYGFRVHVDSAYGGYFRLASNLGAEARAAYEAMSEADSIVVDPHKHGLQPYGCGCVVFRDPAVGRFYRHDSPYTYFSSQELHLGEISLECSRAGAAAVALWVTQRLLRLERGGEFAEGLESSHRAALRLAELLRGDGRFAVVLEPELDIVVWAVKARTASEASRLAQRLFEEAAKRDLHLALMQVPARMVAGLERDQETVTCLRSVLMKREHEEWVERIYGVVGEAAG